MKNREILAIDLGSGYTKVALRQGWNAHAELVRNIPGAPRDLSFCLPSTVAHRTDRGSDGWLIGVDAASQRPDGRTRVFNNWKAALFAGSVAGALGGGAAEDATVIAENFFRQLRRVLQARLSHHDLDDLPVRVCVPRFDDVAIDPMIEAILVRAGWQMAAGRFTVFEPESNAVGVLTRGRNDTWVPPHPGDFQHNPGRTVRLPDMIDADFSARLRMGALSERQGLYGVLVTDIGAFTTDFGLARFDTGFWTQDWNRPLVEQQSCKLGVSDLDDAVRGCLRQEAQDAAGRVTVDEWDRLKPQLYRGEVVLISRPDGDQLRVGAGDEGRAIMRAIVTFAQEVRRARDQFVAAHAAALPFEEVLSGGGASIGAIRDVLAQRVSPSHGFARFAQSVASAFRVELQADALGTALDDKVRNDRELLRGGSAIGGCSVFFDVD